MKFKKLDDLELRHYLNEAIRGCLEVEKVKVNEELSYDEGLNCDYLYLLGLFEEHIKDIIKTNKRIKNGR